MKKSKNVQGVKSNKMSFKQAMVQAAEMLNPGCSLGGLTNKYTKELKWSLEARAKFIQQGWPEFKNDRERIKVMSRRYKERSIAEAFSVEYGYRLKNVSPLVNETPKEVAVGQLIPVRITHIDKDRIDFDSRNLKVNLFSRTNLYKYDKFKHYLPMDEIFAKVTDVQHDKVVIDPLGGMIDSWINPILADKTEDKSSQNVLGNPKPIRVKNLKLTRGGFVGEAVIPGVTEFIGEDYTIPAFIPGSHIVLNIAKDFEQFEGQEVEVFVLNYIHRQGSKQMSLICSRKNYLQFVGNENMISMFNSWCEKNDDWKNISEKTYRGVVSGILNSSKKCGVFVEIPELNFTGMVSLNASELTSYPAFTEVNVKITGFETEMYYNSAVGQMQHVEPYIIENGILRKVNMKPILEFV